MVDKDRPSSWKPYKASLCTSCKAHCCSMPVEITLTDLIRLGWLSEEEPLNKKKVKQLEKEKKIIAYRHTTGLFTLGRTPAGDCLFLNKNRLCTVYEIRPEVCRKFPTEMSPRKRFCPYEKK